MAKRERSINWEKEEKALLREIIRPFMHIIENKDITTNTNKAKINAWTEVTEQFNRANKRIRDKRQLMNQWKVTKLNSKKELSLYRRQSQQTGGGPKPTSPGPETLQILELIPQEFEVDYNEYDCDGTKEISNKENKCDNNTILVDCNKNNTLVESITQQMPSTSEPTIITETTKVDCHLTPTTSQPVLSIREPVATVLTPKRSAKKRMLSDKLNFAEASFEDMHKFRLLESERQQKEHELRINYMAEIHNQVMINLKLQEEVLHKMLDKCSKN